MKTTSRPVARPVIVRAAALLTLAALGVVLSACQTVQGAGRDLQYAGEATERAIQGK